MGFTLEDGRGSGREAGVDKDFRLETHSVSEYYQAYLSRTEGNAYQVSGSTAIAASTKTILTLKNNTQDKDFIVTYIRVMSAGAAATNENAYFTIKKGGAYASGGTSVAIPNMNFGSGVVSGGVAYDDNPTMSGTSIEIDRNYSANSMQSYSKWGSIVVSPGNTISIDHTGSTAAGDAYARISFYVLDSGGE